MLVLFGFFRRRDSFSPSDFTSVIQHPHPQLQLQPTSSYSCKQFCSCDHILYNV